MTLDAHEERHKPVAQHQAREPLLHLQGLRCAGAQFVRWAVSIKRQGLRPSRHFSAARFGNEKAVLRAAQAWRDEVLSLLPPMTRRQLRAVVRKSNTSGVPGGGAHQSRHFCQLGCRGGAALQAQVHEVLRGVEVRRRGARQRAIDARLAMLQELQDEFVVGLPAVARAMEQALWRRRATQRWRLAFGLGLRRSAVAGGTPTAARLLRQQPNRPMVQRYEFASTGPVWAATVTLADGRRTVRRFKVSRYGERDARRLAEEALQELLREFKGP